MTEAEIETDILFVLSSVADQLPANDVQSIRELVQSRELGISFENLCNQIYEYDIKISKGVFDKISSLGNAMNLDQSAWNFLAQLIKY